ncbi:MAG: beta-ketoacyl-[acyl-carrier-protein] synthase family protein [Myxococcota bacterium]|nr:beta-ketoacyl-[acyl-carrier-protein] synthase family protein [Myxococcota bacterium]
MRRRVVVTGRGTVTPHADDVGELFRQLSEGVSAVRRIASFDPEGLASQVAAEVRYEVSGPAEVGPYDLSPRAMRFATATAQRALAEAGIEATDDPLLRARRAVHMTIGVGSTAMEALGPITIKTWGAPDGEGARPMPEFRRAAAGEPGRIRVLEDWFVDQAAPALACMMGADRISSAASACASGSHALFDAVNLIRLGRADQVLAGGVCTPVTRSMMPGFAMLSALTTRNDDPAAASRPFDRDRDGFIMAEGCSLLVLEELEHARKRGATIYGEILGVGIATDAYRLTDPEPTGRGMAAAMTGALADAGVAAERVDYVNAHGTSTKLNDAAETLAIKAALGSRASEVAVSSSKSMFGHLIHAAGVTEAIVCLSSIEQGVVPPTINHEHPDPDCDLDYVPNEARDASVGMALNNSFGFGGQNVSVLLAGYDGSTP